MKGVTIFGNFTVMETFMLNGVQVDKGFDDLLDIYRTNLCIYKKIISKLKYRYIFQKLLIFKVPSMI